MSDITDFDTVTLRDPTSALTARIVPGIGMIGASLDDDGTELLGQRRGVEAYRSDGKTMGIPLLHPWANRLSADHYRVGDTTVELTVGVGGVRPDEHGLPIHGLLAASPDWRVTATDETSLTAELDFAASQLLAGFPFPHRIELHITLTDRTLRYRTTVRATGEVAVPICYGFHPYLQLPDTAREDWVIETPPMHHLQVDGQGIPTGEWVLASAATRPLGSTAYDDGFTAVADGATFAVTGGRRRIEVVFDSGYPAAQLFAPTGSDVVCFEPMTAPTDALRRGGYRTVEPGDSDVTSFAIRVA